MAAGQGLVVQGASSGGEARPGSLHTPLAQWFDIFFVMAILLVALWGVSLLIEATVSGSTFGGCMLKIGFLGVGLRMEICAGGQRIVTSPVKSLRIEHSDS